MKKVQVVYKVGGRAYTYAFDPDVISLIAGDVVEVPVRDGEVTNAIVTSLGSDYDGPCKEITKLVRSADPVWERVSKLLEIRDLQCSDGNWNYDPYMHGLANGLILAVHTINGEGGEPAYLDAPSTWLTDFSADTASNDLTADAVVAAFSEPDPED